MQYPPAGSESQSPGQQPVPEDNRYLAEYPTRQMPAADWLGLPPVIPEWRPSADWWSNLEATQERPVDDSSLGDKVRAGVLYVPTPAASTLSTTSTTAIDIAPPRRRWWRLVFMAGGILLVLLLIGCGGGAYWGYNTYTQMNNEATDGAQHLRNVRAAFQSKKRFSFTTTTLARARADAAAAEQDFQQLNSQLQSNAGLLSIAGSLPGIGKTIRAMPPLARMALDVSTGSRNLLDVLYQLSQGVPQALSPKSPGMTAAQFQQMSRAIHDAQRAFADAQVQRRQFSLADLPSRSLRLSIAEFDALLPTLNASFALADNAIAVAPALLGVTHPASYLIEIMDSTELRAAGGFIGNYGIVKVDHAKLAAFSISDTYLLDRPYLQTHPVSNAPEPYASWWPFQGIWGLRDSNLSPDFPTSARLAEEELAAEHGGSVDGVAAVTPGFVQQLLQITGPIRVPEYHETITPANLEERIHYYQRHESITEALNLPPQDQVSSVEKRFTALFGRYLLAAVQSLPESKRGELFTVVADALVDKDLQLYFNDPQAEQLLVTLHYSDAVLTPPGDSLFVVDTNIGGAKANPYVDEQYHDTIVLDAQGGATHTLVISYHYARNGPLYGDGTGYLDHVRVYVPHSARLQSISGCPASYAPEVEVGHLVYACQFFMVYRDYQTITFRWYVPGAALKSNGQWRYNLLVQKQAGNTPLVIITVTLPHAAKLGATQSLFVKHHAGVTTRHAILSDWSLWLDYAL